ncbi:hypothetical protein [Armatimonas rosea]|uniref:DUF4900 domain-containing protein n=1 Tax=Armatimonas rosea TaxID=685828 RepID=A0A7W9SP52_ARMRO|nr:hypothetical protein [Armatimonas rosea]MBB6049468.1 hypothetical protein [Armatimonas rosea]
MKTKTPQRGKLNRRGVAMVGVMILLFLILSLYMISMLNQGRGGDVASSAKSGLHLTRRRAELLGAQTISEAGVRMSLQWLMQQSSAPTNLTAFAPSDVAAFYGGTTVSGWTEVSINQGPTSSENATAGQVNGTARIRFYPYASNATSNRKMFGIESIGEYQGYSYTSRVFVRQNSFARYAYFSDTAPSGWWVAGSTRFQGPVHVNGVDSTGNAVDPNARINILFKMADWTAPYTTDWIFTYPDDGYFTTAMSYSQINWVYSYGAGAYGYDPNWWMPSWGHITAANRAPKTDQPIIKMPTATTDQKNAALGTASEPAIGFRGVFIPMSGSTPTAGIYIGGDVKDFTMSTNLHSGQDDQIFEIIQQDGTGEKKYVIEVCNLNNDIKIKTYERASPTASWQHDGTTNYTGGTTNGTIYVNGNIGSQTAPYTGGLSGAIAMNYMSGSTVVRPNTWTIATASNKTINIDGGIVYKNLITDGTNPNNLKSSANSATDSTGTLGLVAGNYRVPLLDGGGTALTYLTIHAVTMAYNTFQVVDPTTRAPGVINLLGGFIVKNNSQMGVVQLDGTVNNGFILNRNYDQRISDNPPPAYPAADRSYQVMSFQKVNTTLN